MKRGSGEESLITGGQRCQAPSVVTLYVGLAPALQKNGAWHRCAAKGRPAPVFASFLELKIRVHDAADGDNVFHATFHPCLVIRSRIGIVVHHIKHLYGPGIIHFRA